METASRVREVVERGATAGEHLGAQVFASLHGEPVIDTAFGEARPGEALTPEHLMLWMSAGKPVTAVAVLQQVDRGHAHLDDPVAEYVTGFEQFGKEAVTLKHVLTHTGGFRIMHEQYPRQSWAEAVAAVCRARQEPGWVPGQRAGYHVHSGWYALGAVVESASGEALPGYIREQVFAPLGMDDCWLGMPADVHAGYGGRIVELLDTTGDTPRATGYADAAWCAGIRPGANLYGPANQLAHLYEMMLPGSTPGSTPGSVPGNLPKSFAETTDLKPGASRSDASGSPPPGGDPAGTRHGNVLLEPGTARAAVQRQREGMEDRTFRSVIDWGYGFMINSAKYGDPNVPYGLGPHASEDAFGHGGNQCAVAFADPAHGLAAAVLFNGQPGEPRHQQRLRAVLAALYEDLGLAFP